MRNMIMDKKKKILVVDDEQYNQMAIVNILEVLGVQDIQMVIFKANHG